MVDKKIYYFEDFPIKQRKELGEIERSEWPKTMTNHIWLRQIRPFSWILLHKNPFYTNLIFFDDTSTLWKWIPPSSASKMCTSIRCWVVKDVTAYFDKFIYYQAAETMCIFYIVYTRYFRSVWIRTDVLRPLSHRCFVSTQFEMLLSFYHRSIPSLNQRHTLTNVSFFIYFRLDLVCLFNLLSVPLHVIHKFWFFCIR